MILKELSIATGVSGKEDAVRKIILNAIDGHAEDIRIDTLGNVTAIKKGTGKNLPRVMIAAHMDEIGFMVMGFDSSGLIRFTNIGGVDDRILPGLRVKIGDKGLPGVIIWTPIHLNHDQNVKKLSDLRIDIGATSKDSVSGKLKRGDRIGFDSKFMEIGEKMLRGKAFDDRAGCALLIELLQGGPYPVDILAAFTVQEEIGLRGAKVVAQTLKPDIAFVLETTPAHDAPNPTADIDDDDDVNPSAELGAGPAFTVMDRSMITQPRILNFLRRTAESNHIPYQLKSLTGGGTDAGAIHLSEAGVPAGVISVPCRYIHSPSAFMHRDDYQNAFKLTQAVLHEISFDVVNNA
jgi:endoglucanase